ncbi:TPA: peptidoglycan-binding protein [Clostridium botulinum]|nr:peptidoglycan-binding protein [Clostridium botulinum]
MENKIKLLNNSRNNIDEYKKSNINKLQKNNLNNNENKKSNTNNVIDLKDKLQISNDLSIGSSGKDVSDLQSSLKKIGIYKDSVDGYYGKSTEEAVKKFQKSKNIKETGIADGKVKYEISKDITNKRPIYRAKRSADYNWYDEFNKNMDEFNKHMEEFDKIMNGTNGNNEVNNNSNERVKDTETNQGTKTNDANSSDDFDWDQWSKDMNNWDEFNKHMDDFNKHMDEFDKSMKGTNGANINWDKFNKEMDKLSTDLDKFNKEMDKLSTDLDKFNKEMDKLNKDMDKFNNSMDKLNVDMSKMNKNMEQLVDSVTDGLNKINSSVDYAIKIINEAGNEAVDASNRICNAVQGIADNSLKLITSLFKATSNKKTSNNVTSNSKPQTHYNDIVKDTMKQSKLTDYYGVHEKLEKKTVLVKTKNFEVSLIKSVGVSIPGQWLNVSVNGKNISSNSIIQKTYAGNFLKSICGKFESPAIDLSLGSFSISKDGVELSGSIDIYYSKNIKANGINVTGTAKDSLSVSGKITKDDIDNLKQMGGAAALAVGTALVIGAVSSEVGTYGASTPASVPAFIWGTQLLQHAL